MSLSIPIHKFLLDENVKIQLFRSLQSHGFDIKLSPKSALDKQLAIISKKEKRILITNDEDFKWYTNDEVFAIVWLRIPQNDSKSLLKIFNKLMNKVTRFEGKLIELSSESWEEFPLLFDSPPLG